MVRHRYESILNNEESKDDDERVPGIIDEEEDYEKAEEPTHLIVHNVPPNFPPCFPIVYHNIEEQSRDDFSQFYASVGMMLWIFGIVLHGLWIGFSMYSLYMLEIEKEDKTWHRMFYGSLGISMLFALINPLISFRFGYWPVYLSCRTNNGMRYVAAIVASFLSLMYYLFLMIGVPPISPGIISSILLMAESNNFLGFVHCVAGVLFLIEVAGNLVLIFFLVRSFKRDHHSWINVKNELMQFYREWPLQRILMEICCSS